MATLALNRARGNTGPNEVRPLPEAANQSFEEGEFVYLVSGKVTVCASDGVVIMGMALHDASGVTDTDVEVLIANSNQTFVMSCGEAAAAAIAVADVGVKYGIRVANNRTYVDPADGTNESVVIREPLYDAVDAGDLNPVVIATVIPAAFQGGAAAT